MTLRLQQSIRIEQGPAASQREVQRLVGPGFESPFQYDQDFLPYRLPNRKKRPVPRLQIGPRPEEPPAQTALATPEVVAPRPRAPKWLEGRFRPRNLTFEGQRILERMEPKIVLAEGPVHVLEQAEPWGSLQERMAYLQRKYLLLDMVRKGFAVETDGTFWPAELEREAQRHYCRALARRANFDGPYPPLGPGDAMVWIALFRRASWDQMRALHPGYQGEVDKLLDHLIRQRDVDEERVPFGQGELTLLGLTEKGLKGLKTWPDGRDIVRRGGGVRKVGLGFGELHEQAIGDAIGYFAHEVQAFDGEVLGVTLEKRLRSEYWGEKHIPDFRIEFRTDVGYSHWDVEVLGIGDGIYAGARQRVAEKIAASAVMRGFDPLGRGTAVRDRDVGVGR